MRFEILIISLVLFIEHWNCVCSPSTIQNILKIIRRFFFFYIDFVHSFVSSARRVKGVEFSFCFAQSFLRSSERVAILLFILTAIQTSQCKHTKHNQIGINHRKYIQRLTMYLLPATLSLSFAVHFVLKIAQCNCFQLCFHTCKMDDQTN